MGELREHLPIVYFYVIPPSTNATTHTERTSNRSLEGGNGDEGLALVADGQPQTIAADTVVICAGQDLNRGLITPLQTAGVLCDVIGGADVAAELDALRAVEQGIRLGRTL